MNLPHVRFFDRSNVYGIAVHTSGTSVLDDGSKGEYKAKKIFYDNKPEEIDALDDNAPHRPVDLKIVRARKELGNSAKLVIMTRESVCPSFEKLGLTPRSAGNLWLESEASETNHSIPNDCSLRTQARVHWSRR